jgi:TadE-like protein
LADNDKVRSKRGTSTSRRARGDDGTALVEAAFVFPLMFLLMFGIIEYGIAMGNASTVKQASRTAVRMVATSPKQNAYSLATDAARIDLTAGANVGPKEMWIYKAIVSTGNAADNGFPEAGNGKVGSGGVCPATTCLKYLWNPATKSWGAPSGQWAPTIQNACLGAGAGQYPDAVGVWVKTRYTFFTGLFGNGMDLTSRTVMRLEPVPTAQGCAPS